MGHTSLMVQKILRGTEGNLRLENINPDVSQQVILTILSHSRLNFFKI